MTRRYFDWAATSPPDATLLSENLIQSLRQFANPSSPHAEGRAARGAFESARARCAAALGVPPASLAFTSGGTESNNLVLQSVLLDRSRRGLAVSAVEHPSVAEPARRLSRLGAPLAIVKPLPDGRVAPEALARAIARAGDGAGAGSGASAGGRGIALAAVMAVNNETGALNDIPALAAAAREAAGRRKIHFHCDAVQALGKTPLDLTRWDVDSAAFSAHKLGGPRGVGLLYARTPFEGPYSGGEQEQGIRPGTENLFGALAFAAALEARASAAAVAAEAARAEARWERLIAELKKIGRCVPVPADRAARDERFSPYILQAAFAGVPGEVFVRAMDDLGVALSTGSACSSGTRKRPVLEAMGIAPRTAFEAVRFSQGAGTTDEDIDALIETVRRCLRSLQ